MERGVKIIIKMILFIIIFIILSMIPIFIKFSIVESVSDVGGGFKENHLFQIEFQPSNFYKAVFDKELMEQKIPPSYMAPVLNILLAIIYTTIVFGIINLLNKTFNY